MVATPDFLRTRAACLCTVSAPLSQGTVLALMALRRSMPAVYAVVGCGVGGVVGFLCRLLLVAAAVGCFDMRKYKKNIMKTSKISIMVPLSEPKPSWF